MDERMKERKKSGEKGERGKGRPDAVENHAVVFFVLAERAAKLSVRHHLLGLGVLDKVRRFVRVGEDADGEVGKVRHFLSFAVFCCLLLSSAVFRCPPPTLQVEK